MLYILAATYVALASLWTIAAGLADISSLPHVRTPMPPTATLLVVVLSMSALALHNSTRRTVRMVARVLISLVALASLLLVARSIFGWNLPMERWIAALPFLPPDVPVRAMPVATGIACILAAISLLLIASPPTATRLRSAARHVSMGLLVWVALCGVVAISGRPSWFLDYAPVAPATIFALLLLGIGLWIIAPKPHREVERYAISPWFAALLAAIALGSVTAHHVRSHKATTIKATHALLAAVGDLKVEQVANWRKERINDARILGSTKAVVETISAFLSAPTQTPVARESIDQLLAVMKAGDTYECVTIFDANLNEHVSLGTSALSTLSTDSAALGVSMTTRSPQMSTIEWNHEIGAPRVDILMPLFSFDAHDNFLGLMQFSLDPRKSLFHLLTEWPVPANTADTLLWHHDRETLALLHSSQTDADLQHPLRLSMADHPDAAAVRAVRGSPEPAVGRDYRDTPVLANARQIPGTPWFIAAKIDAVEVFDPLRRHASLVAWFTILLAMASGLGTRLFQLQRQLLTRKALASEVARRHLLTSSSRDGIVILSTNGSVIEANESFARMLGYSIEEVLKLHIWDWDTQMDREEIERHIADPAKGGEIFETRHRRADGSIIDVEISSSTATLNNQRLILAICRNITDRKRAETQLAEREARFRTLFNHSPLGIVLSDLSGNILAVNDAFCAIHKGTREQFTKMNLLMFIPPDERGEREGEIAAMVNGKTLKHELVYRDESGGQSNLLVHEMTISLPENQAGIIGYVEDITSRKQAESNLRESEERFRSTFDLMADGSIIVGFDERVLYANEVIAQQVGLTKDTIIGKYISEVTPELDNSPFFALFRQCLNNRESARVENKYIDKNGNARWYTLIVQPIPEGVFMLSIDITEQRVAQERMHLQSTALNAAANAIVITNAQGTIEWANDAFCQISGFALHDIVGKNQRELVKSDKQDEEFYRNLWGTILSGRVWHGEIVNRRKDGTLYTEDMTITPVKNDEGEIQHFVAIKQDITAQKQLEEQLLRTQRLESVGRLASGIAHDLNNTLAPILLSPALLREGITDPTQLEIINSIESSATRGASIIRQLLAFSRGLEPRRAPLQLHTVIIEVEKLITPSFTQNIALRTTLPQDPVWVNADATQVHQILMNLCINARDAMPNGGEISISLGTATVDKATAKLHDGVNPGHFALLTIRDTGTGIPPEHLKMLFDPFFTTKQVGEGTGLGLSSVLGIVRSHKGFVEVTSTLHIGTEFRVYIPIFLERTHDIPKNLAVELALHGQGETVLVVDDEESIRKLACKILEKNGYHTLEAEHGQAALDVLKKHTGPVAVVVTDMLMPVMDGPTLIRTLRSNGSTMKIIAMSGYLSDPTSVISGKAAPDKFIPKPFTPKILSMALRTVLATTTPP